MSEPIEHFITRWQGQTGGAERANYALFLTELCAVLDVAPPQPASAEHQHNDYVFERAVSFKEAGDKVGHGRIDLYKRGHFVLEAKQSRQQGGAKAISGQEDLFAPGTAPSGRRSAHRNWDILMLNARRQAEDYARALPENHEWPPFIIVCDVGHAFEIFADFTGKGRNYTQFPDRQGFRIYLEDLRKPDIRDRLRLIWTDPPALDPAKKSAEVTRDIAARLARIAKNLEGKHDPKDVAEFLMRCLFSMFAEDVGLLPEDIMVEMLEKLADEPTAFPRAMETLWATMNAGGFDQRTFKSIKQFNGRLFANPKALPLAPEDIHELLVAARMDWRDVEPAIFGTLLERALDPRERSKLGAHYTPRAYVERLVVPTIIEPLRADWDKVQAGIGAALQAGDPATALARAKAFHHELCTIRVLDPACGTGNFLYVSLELLKKLEGEVLSAIDSLGEEQSRLMMEGETVNPRQFYGLELNPRAVPIADLVLWIGYLKWQLRTAGLSAISEPVLHAYGTIRQQDAILAYDGRDLVRDDTGAPLTRWDGVTTMVHPVSYQVVPDPEARIEIYKYRNPRPADWPEVEFIVGNPPFIGGKDMRVQLGDGYAEAVWKARPNVPGGADFVMHFWDAAAERLTRKGTKAHPNYLRRFGFITTNSITQTFSRRVIERHMAAKLPLSLVFAVPDHPWMKASDKAAVRIAMTVAERGEKSGLIARTTREVGLNSDAPEVVLEAQEGRISADLRTGAMLRSAVPLIANDLMAHMGVKLHGAGFIVEGREANDLSEAYEGDTIIRPFLNGRDLVQKPRGVFVIDTDGLASDQLRANHPRAYAVLLERVKPERDQNPREGRKNNWWIYGENASVMRSAVADLSRYIATCRTASHRIFSFIPKEYLAESKVVVVSLSNALLLAILNSRVHVAFAVTTGGFLEDRPTYQHSETFYPFPFADVLANPTIQSRLTELGERLDAFRKERLAAHDFLTMTGLYNVLERIRELEWKAGPGRHSESAASIEPLSERERDIYDAGHIAILKDIHDEIDTLVLAAYGWADLAPRLVGRPGATTPSQYKTDDQLAAEEELLTRLVALNQERAAEEARGLVRWLRPDYQIPKLGHKVARPDGVQQEADLAILPTSDKPKWPSSDTEQINILVDLLRKAPAPVPPETLAATFDGRNTPKRRERIESLLDTLTTIGLARSGQLDGQTRYFIPR